MLDIQMLNNVSRFQDESKHNNVHDRCKDKVAQKSYCAGLVFSLSPYKYIRCYKTIEDTCTHARTHTDTKNGSIWQTPNARYRTPPARA